MSDLPVFHKHATMTAEEVKALLAGGSTAPPRETKYNSTWTEVDGITFQSETEAKRYPQLVMMSNHGLIHFLQRQRRFYFRLNGVTITYYKADFVYLENGELVVEDVKGYKTRAYEINKKLMRAFYGIEIRET